ncbi:MAG: heme-binding protein [Sediminibacterium sp.]|nr:heme-binding protein [Sediminibacterium sp.]
MASTIYEQPYKVIKNLQEAEIRFYPPAVMATVISAANSYKEVGNKGFRQLANYIFGGNQDNKKIAMTAPVHMQLSDKGSSMSFVMPPDIPMQQLPKPNQQNIKIENTPAEYVAAIRFGGYASDRDIQNYSQKLADILVKNGIAHQGNFRFLGYDAPYRFFGRRNEIIVTVQWKA